MPVEVNKEICIGCGACVGVCPVGALSLDEDGKAESNREMTYMPFGTLKTFSFAEILKRIRSQASKIFPTFFSFMCL